MTFLGIGETWLKSLSVSETELDIARNLGTSAVTELGQWPILAKILAILLSVNSFDVSATELDIEREGHNRSLFSQQEYCDGLCQCDQMV